MKASGKSECFYCIVDKRSQFVYNEHGSLKTKY